MLILHTTPYHLKNGFFQLNKQGGDDHNVKLQTSKQRFLMRDGTVTLSTIQYAVYCLNIILDSIAVIVMISFEK